MEKDRISTIMKYELAERTSNCIDSELNNSNQEQIVFMEKNNQGVTLRKSEMYAYDVINCVTKGASQYVREFWKYYNGKGTQPIRALNVILIEPSTDLPTVFYMQFKDLGQKCPNLTVNILSVSLPTETIALNSEILISKYVVTDKSLNVSNFVYFCSVILFSWFLG
jgi:hypothetical protein